MDGRNRASLEDRRQIEHLVPVGFAFTLPYLPYWAIVSLAVLAVGHALIFSPRLIRVTTRDDEAAKGFSPGKLYYALTVLALILVFRERIYIAAAVWGILSVGDSLSNIIGRRLGGPLFPYNSNKTLSGFLSFWIFGALAAWALLIWNAPREMPWSWATLALFSAIAALFCALAESLPPVIDDNLAVPWVGALTFWLLFEIRDPAPLAAAPWTHALGANLAAAVAARVFGWLSWRGTVLALAFGLLIYGSMGWQGFLVISLFLILASVATKAGFRRKASLQVAQADQGQRGISNILSNGAVALTLAVFAFWLEGPVIKVAYCAAIATAAFDTVSTEIGQWLGKRPYSPITWSPAKVGTPGAVSLEGTAAGVLAALLVGLFAPAIGWLSWVAAAAITAGAVAGAMFESVLAALFDYRFPYSDEALNFHSTLVGAFLGGFLWRLLA